MTECDYNKVLAASFIFDDEQLPTAIANIEGVIEYKNRAWDQLTNHLTLVKLPKILFNIQREQDFHLTQWPTNDLSENWHIINLTNQENNTKGFFFKGKNDISGNHNVLEYHKMINASKDGLTLINRHYCYKLCNEAFTMNKEIPCGDIIGKSISEVWGEKTFQNYIKPNLDECFQGKTVNYQLWIQFSENIRRYMDVTYWPYRENGEVTHVVVNSRDITDIKIVEIELKENLKKAEIAAAVKSQFLSNMSHEIRTPLNGIIGTLSLLERDSLSKENQEFLNIIESSSASLLSLVNDILDHSKIEAGKMDIETIRFSPQKTILEIIELFNYLAKSKSISMTTILDKSLPQELMGDPGRLKQVLSNLLSNALKYTDKGEVKVSVEVLSDDQDNLIPVRFKVKDTGKGIAPHTLSKLFSPFEQGEHSGHHKQSGTGLGLSISKSLVEMMNGEIGVYSTPKEGSEFWFIIRFEKASEIDISNIKVKSLSDTHILCFHQNLSSLKYLKNELQNLSPHVNGTHQQIDLNLDTHPDFIFIHDTSINESIPVKKFFKNLYPNAIFIYLTTKGFRGESKIAWVENYKAYLTGEVNMGIFENTLTALSMTNHLDQIVTKYTTPHFMPKDLRILICEDNHLNQKLLSKILQGLGFYHIDIEDNGLCCLKAAKTKKYDLIFMDIRLPELDGLEATRLIRQDSLNMQTYIVAITGDVMETSKQACLKAGINDYLAKPFTKQQFQKFIQQLELD